MSDASVLDQASGRDWHLWHGDACEVAKGIPDDSIGLSVSSCPFSSLYVYSDSIADMGNCGSDEQFFEHYTYLIRELYRVIKPGRLCVVHCKDMSRSIEHDGYMGIYDFPGDVVRAFESCGWVFHSRVMIWKDPVGEMQRTKNHGLLYKQLCKDSCASRQGRSDYLLAFRKWSEGVKDPVTVGGERFNHYVGLEPPDAEQCLRDAWYDGEDLDVTMPYRNVRGKWPKYNPFPEGSASYRRWSISVWQKYASPVWFDIDQKDMLGFREARDDDDCKHLCPLQLDVIERCIHLWSNPGDVVFSPFAGIGSEVYTAVKCGRKGLGIELKGSYFEQASAYLRQLEAEMGQPRLFDMATA